MNGIIPFKVATLYIKQYNINSKHTVISYMWYCQPYLRVTTIQKGIVKRPKDKTKFNTQGYLANPRERSKVKNKNHQDKQKINRKTVDLNITTLY